MTTATLELRDKFAKLESDISAAKGDFAFYALFAREDLPDRWDLMISAPWASADRTGAIEYFVARIKTDIEPDALVKLSRIIIIDPEEASMQKLNRTIRVEHGAVEVRDTDFFGVPIKHAYIITSKTASPALAG